MSWDIEYIEEKMTKSELIEAFATKKIMPLYQADRIIDEIINCMTNALISGDRIEVRGFGSFENREYIARDGRNPKTGEVVTLKPRKSPFFKVGKELKERIMKG